MWYHSWGQVNSSAQDPVPITVTIPTTNHAITRITFPGITEVVYSTPEARTQFKLENEVPVDQDGRYRVKVQYWVGSSPNPREEVFSFEKDALCEEEDPPGTQLGEGVLIRISCSVVERGVAGAVVCSAVYQDMDDPPDQCTGTIACKKCAEVRVCGSNPQCY